MATASPEDSNPREKPASQRETEKQFADRPDIDEKIADLERQILDLQNRIRGNADSATGSSDGKPSSNANAADGESESGIELTPAWDRDTLETRREFRGVYDKPFLAKMWRRAYIGGYTEMEYHSFEDGIQGIPEGFRMHRTNLFLFTDVAQNVRFGAEIEFETEFDGASNSSDIEIAVEMAMLDWTIYEEFIVRGGVILPPLGRININHDGPVRELTERPLVSTFIIPTTLSEVGGGVHGVFHPTSDLSLNYQSYAVNGFNLLDAGGQLAVEQTGIEGLLRAGRTSLGGDVNDGIASTGRLGLEWADVVQLGGSWHVGTYDERGDNLLSIFAGDLACAWGPFAIEGEIAVSDFQRDAFAQAAGVPDIFWGYSVQPSFGGMPESLRRLAPQVFGQEGARLAFAIRWDWIDLDGDRGEVIEPGITFRPVADTIFKFSYRFTPNSFGLRGVPGTETYEDEGFVFSLSTYF